MFKNVNEVITYCFQCQVWDQIKYQEKELHSIWIFEIFKKVVLNCILLLMNMKKNHLIKTQNNLNEWVENRIITSADLKTVIKFLWKNIICWHECFNILITNKDSENKNILEILIKKYEIKHICMFLYNSQANRQIKIDHKLIADTLSKLMMKEKIRNKKNWIFHISAILWVNKITVNFSMRILFFRMFYEYKAVLLIELNVSIW